MTRLIIVRNKQQSIMMRNMNSKTHSAALYTVCVFTKDDTITCYINEILLCTYEKYSNQRIFFGKKSFLN